MSAVEKADEVCASCGIAAVDNIKLKDCDDGCDLVKYCSDGCQDNHREQHEEACKKRVEQLRDVDLFTQPDEIYPGECPLCCLPMSIDLQKSMLMHCCTQRICLGCYWANKKREMGANMVQRCAFCREPEPKSKKETEEMLMVRANKNDPVAMCAVGKKYRDKGNYRKALKYFTKAAELGDVDSHYELAAMYKKGRGVNTDEIKEVYHLEQAAIGGEPWARYQLGMVEWNKGRYDRAKKHLIIAANIGYHDSLRRLLELHVGGHATKEDCNGALRAYQAAVEETKSREREVGEAAIDAAEAKRGW